MKAPTVYGPVKTSRQRHAERDRQNRFAENAMLLSARAAAHNHGAAVPIILSIVHDNDQTFTTSVLYRARRGETVRSICASRGRPDLAAEVARMNHLRSTGAKLRPGLRLRLPGVMRAGESVSVVGQDSVRPTITDGYAIMNTVARPGAKGLAQHSGYNPYAMTLPVELLMTVDYTAEQIEADCELLERMAGRGNFAGAASGPPPALRVSSVDKSGRVVPLIPRHLQYSKQNPRGPLWRIMGASNPLDWDDGAIVNAENNRIRQLVTITLAEDTPLTVVEHSAGVRSRQRTSAKKKG